MSISTLYHQFFYNECLPQVPESIRPITRAIVDYGEKVLIFLENEVQRLRSEEHAMADLVTKIAIVASIVILTCCSPVAAWIGAGISLLAGNEILAGLRLIKDSSPFLQIAAVAGAIIITCVVGNASCIVFNAVLISVLVYDMR